MKIAVRLVLVLALIALGFWLWTVLFPSPEKIVHQKLLSLATDVSFSPDENNLVKMAHVQSVADFFTTNVEVDINVPGRDAQTLSGRDEITTAVMASRQTASSLQVKFPDINVTVAPDKNSAVADVTVDATVSGEHDAVVQEVKFTFEKVDGHWLISKVETVKTVS